MSNFNSIKVKLNRHPIFFVEKMLKSCIDFGFLSPNANLTFSKYKYKPQSYEDERIVFNFPLQYLDKSSLFDMLIDLDDGEELALHSEIIDFNSTYHFPLIDFGGKDNKLFESTFIKFCNYWNIEFQVYSSGRSYHGYGNRLLSKDEWIKFMGSLLLLNNPGSTKIIDDRWVGHRILAGYSSLRWSRNTAQYKKYPTHLGILNANGFFNEGAFSRFADTLINQREWSNDNT